MKKSGKKNFPNYKEKMTNLAIQLVLYIFLLLLRLVFGLLCNLLFFF